jgi:hypothetical protein
MLSVTVIQEKELLICVFHDGPSISWILVLGRENMLQGLPWLFRPDHYWPTAKEACNKAELGSLLGVNKVAAVQKTFTNV